MNNWSLCTKGLYQNPRSSLAFLFSMVGCKWMKILRLTWSILWSILIGWYIMRNKRSEVRKGKGGFNLMPIEKWMKYWCKVMTMTKVLLIYFKPYNGTWWKYPRIWSHVIWTTFYGKTISFFHLREQYLIKNVNMVISCDMSIEHQTCL